MTLQITLPGSKGQSLGHGCRAGPGDVTSRTHPPWQQGTVTETWLPCWARGCHRQSPLSLAARDSHWNKTGPGDMTNRSRLHWQQETILEDRLAWWTRECHQHKPKTCIYRLSATKSLQVNNYVCICMCFRIYTINSTIKILPTSSKLLASWKRIRFAESLRLTLSRPIKQINIREELLL